MPSGLVQRAIAARYRSILRLLFSPVNPLLSNDAPGAAYDISYSPPLPLNDLHALVALLPSDGVVLASNDLFPLVANDVNAYSMFWGPNPNLELPFNLSHLPDHLIDLIKRSLKGFR